MEGTVNTPKKSALVFLVLLAALGSTCLAQDPAPDATPDPAQPEPVWSGSAGGGLSITGGNTDTTNINLSFDIVRDPKLRNILKFYGLYLRGEQSEEVIADRLRLGIRNEFTLNDRTFVFGEFSYLRDPFKEIDYLINPVGGLGFKLYNTDKVSLDVNGGAGVVWEKNPGLNRDTSGTLNAGQSFVYKFSDSAEFTQVWTGMWKMNNFSDVLYHFGVGLSSSIIKSLELKVEFLLDHKNVTPSPDVKKMDTAFLTSVLYRF
jgi:putative salt-induced outer membrane protein